MALNGAERKTDVSLGKRNVRLTAALGGWDVRELLKCRQKGHRFNLLL